MVVVEEVLVDVDVVDDDVVVVSGGPDETMIVTVEPSSTCVPEPGCVPMTRSSATVVDDSRR